jgi:hypothetical protein
VLIAEPRSYLIPCGMMRSSILMFVERGFSKAMALSHVALWISLLLLLTYDIATDSIFPNDLMVLFIVDFISACFDVKVSCDWLKGGRTVAS